MKASKEQVFRAAEQLLKSGDKPTLAAVRGLLGGGSYTSIQEGLAEWKAHQSRRQAASEAAPASIAERLGAFGIEIWRLATEQATARLEAEREGLEQARHALELERLEAAELADKLAAEVEQLKAQLAEQAQQAQAAELAATEALAQAREALAATREDAAQAKGELAGVRSLYGELLARLPKAEVAKTQDDTGQAKPAKATGATKAKAAKKATGKTVEKRIPEEQPLPL